MVNCIIDCLLGNPKQRHANRRRQCIYCAIGLVQHDATQGLSRFPNGPVQMVFHCISETEQMQDGWFGRFDDLAQILH